MGRMQPAAGTVLKTTTLEETLPAAPAKEGLPDFWTYQNSLTAEEWIKHITYVYRWLENGERAYCLKFTEPIDEVKLKDALGGGTFRIIMKKNSQICHCVDKIRIEGPAKLADETPRQLAVGTVQQPSNGGVDRLCDLLEKMILRDQGSTAMNTAMQGALQLQADGFKSVVTNVRDLAPQQSAANPMSDPMQMLTWLAQVKTLFAVSTPTNSITETLQTLKLLKESGLMPSGPEKFNLAAEVLRIAPTVIAQISTGMSAMATAKTAEANAIAASVANGGRPPINIVAQPPQPQAMPPQPIPETAAPMPEQPAAQAPAGGSRAPNPEWIMERIAAIVMNLNISVTEAAEETLTFLQNAAPTIMEQLFNMGQLGIEQLFSYYPQLAVVPKNPRLTEFISKFIEMGTAGPPIETAPIAQQETSAAPGA